MKILIPVDGSDGANRAVDYVIENAALLREAPKIWLLNAQWNIASGNVKLFVSQQTINDYYREQGLAALAIARDKLDAVKLDYAYQISIGTPAEAIVQYAREQQIDQIVMGKSGQGSLSALLLGSVVNKVLCLASVPVLIVN